MNGEPPELLLRLCAEVGAHPHFVAPAKGVDANTDYMTELATYCRDNAPSWMVPRFEGPNELWNTSAGFAHTIYADHRQSVLNGATLSNGVPVANSYSASAMVYPTDIDGNAWSSGKKYMKITLSTTGNTFSVGSRVNFNNAWGGVSSINSTAGYIEGINIGGDPNTVTANIPDFATIPDGVPSSGSYTSGGAITPVTDNRHDWYGSILSRMGQDISAVYGDDRSRYGVICGLQTGTGDTSGNRRNSIPRLASYNFVKRSPPTGYTASAAMDWVTHIAIAQYYNPTAQTDGTEATKSAAYAGATWTGSISGTALSTSNPNGTIAIGMTIQGIGYDDETILPNTVITAGSGSSWTINKSQTVPSMYMVGGIDMTAPTGYAPASPSVSGLATISGNWKTWAQGYGIQKMCGYEGGYSPDLASSGNSNTDRLKVASKIVPGTLYDLAQAFSDFASLNDETFVAEFPSYYLLSSNPYTNGYTTQIWSLLDDIYQPNTSLFEAARLFNANKRRLVIRT